MSLIILFSVQQNKTLSKLYAKDFGQDVVVTKNNTKQVQHGNTGVIRSQSTESYQSEAMLDYEINGARENGGKIQFRFSKFVVEDGVTLDEKNYCPYDYVQIVKIINKGEDNEKEEIVDTICGTTGKRIMSAESFIPPLVKMKISASKSKMKTYVKPVIKRDYFKWVTVVADTLLFKFKSGNL